ncbi:MAG: YesL family protein [Lachnospiraceae bacterium]|nr:YesL family protein [Lachnospiraceae bacterium]
MFGKLLDPEGPLNRIADMIIGSFLVGLFTVLCSIPLITAGTAFTAGYYAMAKSVRHHEGYVWKEYFRSFAKNIKQGLALGTGYVIAALVIVFDFVYLKERTDSFGNTMFMILIVVTLVWLMTFFFVFFELSRFDRKGFDILRFGVITAFRHFVSSIGIVLMFGISFLLVYLMPWGFALFPGFAFFGATFLMERVMRKYMPAFEEGSEEAEKWYNKKI